MNGISLGEFLRNRRTELGYTQEEVAKVLNIHYQLYQTWEYGTSKPNLKNLKKLSNMYKVESKVLLELVSKYESERNAKKYAEIDL